MKECAPSEHHYGSDVLCIPHRGSDGPDEAVQLQRGLTWTWRPDLEVSDTIVSLTGAITSSGADVMEEEETDVTDVGGAEDAENNANTFIS